MLLSMFYLPLLRSLSYLYNSITVFHIVMFHITLSIICIACGKGFLGVNCDTNWPYPMYGEECQSKCYCNKTNCDHVVGCTESSGGKPQYK